MNIVNTVSHFTSAHENLGFTTRKMQRVVGKLSSGQEVSSARDGVGEFAIGSRLLAEAKALRAVHDNAVQTRSVLQSADSVLGRIEDMLVRMNALSLAASSDNMGQHEREMVNIEFQALKEEICRETKDLNDRGRYYLGPECKAPFSDFEMIIVFPSRLPADPAFPRGVPEVIDPGEFFEADFVLRNSLDQPVTNIRLTNARIMNGAENGQLGQVPDGEILIAPLAPGAIERTNNVEDLDVIADPGMAPDAPIQLTLNVEFVTQSGFIGRYRAVFESRKLNELRDGDRLPILELVPIDENGRDIIPYDRIFSPRIGTGINPVEDSIGITLPESGPGRLTPNLFSANLLNKGSAEDAIKSVQEALDKVIQARAQLGSQLERIGYADEHVEAMRVELDGAAAKMLAADIAQRVNDYSNLNLLMQLGINAIGLGLDMHRQAQGRFINIVDNA